MISACSGGWGNLNRKVLFLRTDASCVRTWPAYKFGGKEVSYSMCHASPFPLHCVPP